MIFLRCSFQALVSLAKAYSSIGDGEKTVQLLTTMIEYDMVLPNAFVRDLCWKAGVSEGVRCVCVCCEVSWCVGVTL